MAIPNGKGVSSPQRQMALLSLTKTGGAAPVLSGLCAKFCTISRASAGVYEIEVNIQRPFAQKIQAVGTPHAAGFVTIDPALTDKLKLTVKTFSTAAAPDDLDFELAIIGSYALDLLG